MTVKRAKIQIDVEATTEGAVRGMDRVAAATEKSRKAVEKNDAALKAARLEYQVAQARAENLAATQAKLAAKTNEAARAFALAGRAMASSNPALSTGASGWSSIAAGAGRAAGALGIVAAAGIGAASMAADLAQESLQLTNMFAALPYSLNAARDATRGLADDSTLARNAIMANQAGVATSAKAYGELVGMAQTLAMKMGRDVNDTVERVTLGIAKQEREILDELVILPRMEEMWRAHAETLGKTTAELSDHEKTSAFTKSAIEALRKATQGVEVDMGGAAAAIARTTVELKNMKTAALGGVERAVSLAEGVRSLDSALLRQVAQMRTYRGSFYQVADALEQAGVDTEKYRNNAVALEKDIQRALKAEGRRIALQAEHHTLTVEQIDDARRLLDIKGLLSDVDRQLIQRDLERVGALKEQEAAAAAAAAEENKQRQIRLVEIEEQLAFGRGAQIAQSQLNALVAEEAELRAQVLEAEGKLEEAAEVRRKAQLAALEQLGETTRPRGGGGRRRDRSAERAREQQEQAERMRATWETHNALANAIRAKRAADAETLRTAAAQDLEIELDNVIDFEERRAQAVLAGRLREIELQRAAGVDPITLAQRETDAKLQALAAQEEAVRQRADREVATAAEEGDYQGAAQARAEQELALLDLQDQREAELHALALARLEERARKEAEVHDRRQAIAQESMDLALGAAAAIVQGAVIEGKALRSVVAATAKGEAMRHGLVLGPSALAGAAFQFAWGNIPQGTALLASAGQSFAFAASMAALGAAVGAFGGGGGRGKQVAGFGAGAFGPGSDAGAANVGGYGSQRSASGGSWDIGGAVPLSADTRRRVGSMAAMPSMGGAVVVHATTHLNLLGQPDDHTMLTLEQAQMRTAARVGRRAAGGRL